MTALADAKAHLNITDDADDTLITAKIAAAESYVTEYTGAEDAITYADASADVQEAILRIVAHWYEDREGAPIPVGVYDLLAPHRTWCF